MASARRHFNQPMTPDSGEPHSSGLAEQPLQGVGRRRSSWLRLPLVAASSPDRSRLAHAKRLRRVFHSAWRQHFRNLRRANQALAGELDPRGKYLTGVGGCRLYERWIETPQHGGPLPGVRAFAIGQSVLVRGGDFSYTQPFVGTRSTSNPMLDAIEFAEAINTAADSAESDRTPRAKRIASDQQEVDKAENRESLEAAFTAYHDAVIALPAAYRMKFKDYETMPPDPRPRRRLQERWIVIGFVAIAVTGLVPAIGNESHPTHGSVLGTLGAVIFVLSTIVLLFLLGRRIRAAKLKAAVAIAKRREPVGKKTGEAVAGAAILTGIAIHEHNKHRR